MVRRPIWNTKRRPCYHRSDFPRNWSAASTRLLCVDLLLLLRPTGQLRTWNVTQGMNVFLTFIFYKYIDVPTVFGRFFNQIITVHGALKHLRAHLFHHISYIQPPAG